MLIDAKCPMIIAGQGVLYAEASDELLALAELLDVPVMTTTDGKSGFPEDHALALGSGGIVYTGHGRHFLLDSDVIFAIGTSLDPAQHLDPDHPAGKKIIHATNDARDLYKAQRHRDADPRRRQARAGAAGRGGEGPARQEDARRPARGSEIATLQEAMARTLGGEAALDRAADQPVFRDVGVHAASIPSEDAIVTHDSGSPRDQLLPFYVAKKPRGYLGWGKSHQLGTGLGLAIGAKVGAPDKFCVNFMGDAAFGMTGLDFETAARCGIPITTIVLNNSTMAIETHAMALSRTRSTGRAISAATTPISAQRSRRLERARRRSRRSRQRDPARPRQNEERPRGLLEFITSAETAFSHRQ